MPSWPIHFKIADRMAQLLNISDYDSYLYGSVLPDVPKRMGIPKHITHYYDHMYKENGAHEDIVNLEKFENDYSNMMDNPLILGYYIHLLTDYYYNRYVSYNKWIDTADKIGYYAENGENIYVQQHGDRVFDKQSDFGLYGKKLYAKGIKVPVKVDTIIQNNKVIKHFIIPDNEIIARVDYLNNGFKDQQIISENEKYKMFNDLELDRIFANCLLFIENRLYEKHYIDGKEKGR